MNIEVQEDFGTEGLNMQEETCVESTSVVDIDNDKREIDLLRRRVKTSDTLLSYLKSKARIMTIPQISYVSCGIKKQEGVGMVDKKGVPMAEWGKEMQHIEDENTRIIRFQKEKSSQESQGGGDEHIESIAKIVIQITDSMEVLLKRSLLAEAEMDVERERVKAGQDEVNRNNLQLVYMQTRLEQMEKMAKATNEALKEMQSKLEDMEKETSRQRQRAADNEQELSKVRDSFGLLKSSIDFVNRRETIANLERRIQEVESLSERLSTRVSILESGNEEKEEESRRLLTENIDLLAQLDLKEASLAAARDEIKWLFNSRNKG